VYRFSESESYEPFPIPPIKELAVLFLNMYGGI